MIIVEISATSCSRLIAGPLAAIDMNAGATGIITTDSFTGFTMDFAEMSNPAKFTN